MKYKKILICDDDEGILEMMQMILEDDFMVIAEQNSLNVYTQIEKEKPDLILMDLWMPVLSGDQILKNIRKNEKLKNIPVIIISASTDGKKIASEAGANGFISKPFDMDNLLETVKSLVP